MSYNVYIRCAFIFVPVTVIKIINFGRNSILILFNMKIALILFICAGVHLAYSYDEKYDKIEIENIVAHDAIHTAVNDCILGVVDCGPYWKEVRKLAPEIARDRCAHCTERQKVVVSTYIAATKKKYPDTWNRIHDMFKKS